MTARIRRRELEGVSENDFAFLVDQYARDLRSYREHCAAIAAGAASLHPYPAPWTLPIVRGAINPTTLEPDFVIVDSRKEALMKLSLKLLARVALACALAAIPTTISLGQSTPGLYTGFVPSAAQWNSYFAAKQDYLGFTPLNPSSVTGSAPITVTPGSGVVTIGAQTGTSGHFLPFLDGANTWGAKQTFGLLFAQSSAAYASTTAGDWEYDGKAFANLPAASDRGIVPSIHYITTISDLGGADVNTAQSWFPGASFTTYNAVATTSYFFEGILHLTRAAGANSHTIGVLLGGTATFTSINYTARSTSTTGNVLGAVSAIRCDAATSCVVTAASTSTTENNEIYVNGILRINGAGSVIPQFIFSAAPGGAPTVKTNSFFRLFPMGSNNVVTVGNNN